MIICITTCAVQIVGIKLFVLGYKHVNIKHVNIKVRLKSTGMIYVIIGKVANYLFFCCFSVHVPLLVSTFRTTNVF